MQQEEFQFISHHGLQLFATSWQPEKVKGVVCLIHGLGEHLGRYQHVAHHLTQHGFACYAYDQRGHGKTPGKRGHAQQQPLWIDVENFMKKARADHLEVPMFLYGHSWGGNVVSNYLLRQPVHELTAAILTSPWFQLSFEPPAWQVKLGQMMSTIYPSFTQSNQLKEDFLSRDPQVGKDYREDPLVHDRISAGLFAGTLDSGRYALEHAHTIKIPTLVMHGTDDQITSYQASEAFAASNDLIQLKLWPQYRHETHNEIGKEAVLQFITDWLQQYVN